MKDNLLEMLMNLFETSLSQLQKNHQAIDEKQPEVTDGDEIEGHGQGIEAKYFKSPQHESTRIFTYEEQTKLTKAGYQFLKRMKLWGMIDADILELVMNQVLFSDSHVVTLEEVKWTIRNVMVTFLTADQMTFLDLVLYHKEDELIAH